MAEAEVWLVHYSTGEYDDFQSRVVGTFTTQIGAKRFAKKANDALREAGLHVEDKSRVHDYEWKQEVADKLGVWISYTGGRFHAAEEPMELQE
jgi:hypothetical protein